jgi:hypothetical protein
MVPDPARACNGFPDISVIAHPPTYRECGAD